MSLNGVIARFATGTYTVTRTAAGTLSAGHYTAGATSTFSIVASVQPASGRSLRVLAEGRRGDEVRELYTTTELRLGAAGSIDPDTVSIDGETWEVCNVKRSQHFGETHYVVLISRKTVP